MNLAKACQEAVKEGSAVRICGSAIQFTEPIDHEKLRQFEMNYAIAVDARIEERHQKELEAWKKLERAGPLVFKRSGAVTPTHFLFYSRFFSLEPAVLLFS